MLYVTNCLSIGFKVKIMFMLYAYLKCPNLCIHLFIYMTRTVLIYSMKPNAQACQFYFESQFYKLSCKYDI
jgi:hypothetical protein